MTDEFNFSKFHEKSLSIQRPGISCCALMPFDNIQVLDWRPDTTCIGFEKQAYYTIPNISTQIKNYLLKLIDLKRDSNLVADHVVVCLKKLWITQYLKFTDGYWKGGIIWKVDCFKKENDKITYLCQVDTIIEKLNGKFQQDAPNLISVSLQVTAEKIYSAFHTPGKPGQFVDVNQFKNSFNNIPILIDQQKKKGLYMTYKQFLNNTPSTEHFEVKKDKYTDALYTINSTGAYQLERNLWGYCDGQNMYVKSGEKYFQLYRVNNTFYIYGSKNIEKYVEIDPGTASLLNLATNSGRKITIYTISSSPYQLDITNGYIY